MPKPKKKDTDWTGQEEELEEDIFIPKKLNPEYIPNLQETCQAYLFHGKSEEKVARQITEQVIYPLQYIIVRLLNMHARCFPFNA